MPTQSLEYRMDYRDIEEFRDSIKFHTEQEIKYMIDFLDRWNGIYGRHKRDFTVIPWGAYSTDIFVESDDSLYRPDFLLCRNYDNSYIVKKVVPIEVTTCKILDIDVCYLKQEKVERGYKALPSQVATNKQHILFIRGRKEQELFTLLKPSFLKTIKENGIKNPKCLGSKSCYWFKVNDVKWEKLYPENTNIQVILELGEREAIYATD